MQYAARRLVRIVPPYYVAIALLAGVFLIFRYVPGAMPGVTWVQILRQALFIDGGTSFLNPSFWTLPIEFRWYFLFPVALWLWTRSPRAFFGAMVCCGLFVATMKQAGDLTVLPGFLLGIVAADVRTRRHRGAWLALPACVAMFAVCFLLYPNRTGHGEVGPAWEIASFFLVIAAGAVPLVERALSVKALVAVGVASYGIYLVHQPAIVLTERIGWPAAFAAVAGVGVGFAFWWLAERPFVSGTARTVLLRQLDLRASQISAYLRLPSKFAVGAKSASAERTEMAA
jgi:peptidoglycan/LPS O-acetylase OafA/YrhL